MSRSIPAPKKRAAKNLPMRGKKKDDEKIPQVRGKRKRGEQNHPAEQAWRNRGRIYVKELLQTYNTQKRKITVHAIADGSGIPEGDISRYLSDKGTKSSHDFFHKLAKGIASAKGMNETQRTSLEVNFALHSGLLPTHLLIISSEAHERAIGVIAALVTMLAEQLPDLTGAEQAEPEKSDRFGEILRQLEGSMQAWNAIFTFSAQRKQADDWPDVERLWQPVETLWSTMSDQQRAFAVIERASMLATRGLTSDALVLLREALARFPMEQDPEPSLHFLYSRMYQALGNVYREAGLRKRACSAYDTARKYAETMSEAFALYRQEVNAFLRVVEPPDDEYISMLRDILKAGKFDGQVARKQVHFEFPLPLAPSLKIGIHHTLAWYYRNLGAKYKDDAIKHSDAALQLAIEHMPPRDIAISQQYAAETHLRAGNYVEAKELALTAYDTFKQSASTFVRRGWALTLAGRAVGYLALQANGSEEYLAEAVSLLSQADETFSLMGTSQRRAQALNDLGKFSAHQMAITGSAGAEVQQDFAKARKIIERAQSILLALDTYKTHDTWANQVNLFLVDYIAEITQSYSSQLEGVTIKSINAFRDKIDDYLKYLETQKKDAALGSRQLAYGHRARLQVMSVGLNLIIQLALIGKSAQRNSFFKTLRPLNQRAMEWASKHDPLAVHECRWLLILATHRVSRLYPSDLDIHEALEDLVNEWK